MRVKRTSEWIQQRETNARLVRDAIRVAGTQAKLAEALDIRSTAVPKYLSGESPIPQHVIDGCKALVKGL